MAYPRDIGVIDLMLSLPVSDDNREYYASMKPLLMDEQSREAFKMPAEYMFKDIPRTVAGADKVGWTVAQMDRFNIERAMCNFNPDRAGVAEALDRHRDRFILSYECNPNHGMDEVRRIKRLKRDHGVAAVTCFPPGLNPQVPINDKRLFPIYAACVEEELSFFCTTGICGPRLPSLCQKTELIEEVVWFFPELKFVMRHGGEPWADMAVKLLLKWPNLYYSTSAFAPRYYPQAIIDFANTRGADKVMYAGYFPAGLSLDRIFGELDQVPFKDEVWPKFLRENALALFGLS